MTQKKPDIIELDDSDDEPSAAKTSTKSSVEVCLSSDSDDDIILDDIINKDGIEFLAKYEKKGSDRRNRDTPSHSSTDPTISSQSDSINTNDSSLSPRHNVLLPPRIKSSPKTPSEKTKSNEELAKLADMDKRFKHRFCIDSKSVKSTSTPEPFDGVCNDMDEPMDQSFSSSNTSINEEQIEGVSDNSPTSSEDIASEPTLQDSIATKIEQMMSPSPLKEVLVKSDVCIQNETETKSEIQEMNENLIEKDYYVCSFEGCGQDFNNALLHYKHEKKHSNELKSRGIGLFKCKAKSCPFVGLTHMELIYHNSEHVGIYMCRDSLCLFRAENAESLNRHIKNQHNKKTRRKQRGIKCNCGEFSCR